MAFDHKRADILASKFWSFFHFSASLSMKKLADFILWSNFYHINMFVLGVREQIYSSFHSVGNVLDRT